MLRNATMRLIAAHLVLVAVSTALVLGFLYWRVGGVIDAEQRAVVEAELRGLADDYRARRRARARRAPSASGSHNPPDRDAVYLLADADGRRIAGNLVHWPPTVAPDAGWTTLELYRTDRARPTEISALALRLPRRRASSSSAATSPPAPPSTAPSGRALLWALAAITALSLATGWLLSRLVSGRIAEIDGAARGIMAGALDRRVALRGTGDEFDRLAGTLNAMLDRIETLVRDLRTVTDSLAHDLRSPLGRLDPPPRGRRRRRRAPDARQARIEQALREAEGVLATATALLDISRIDAGIGAEQFTAGRPRPPRRRRRRALRGRRRGARRPHRLRDRPPASWSAATTSSSRSPLSNLVENALKHAPAGSTITVAASRDGGRPALVVADRGPGIPAADRERALGRFVRLDPSRGSPGAGLGLALVAAVARMHGAEIVLGDNGPGLRATLRFPEPRHP